MGSKWGQMPFNLCYKRDQKGDRRLNKACSLGYAFFDEFVLKYGHEY